MSRIVSDVSNQLSQYCEWFHKSNCTVSVFINQIVNQVLFYYHTLTEIQWSWRMIDGFLRQVTIIQCSANLKNCAIKWALFMITNTITRLEGRRIHWGLLWQYQKDSFAPCFIMLVREREIKLALNAWISRSVGLGIQRRRGRTRIQKLSTPELL